MVNLASLSLYLALCFQLGASFKNTSPFYLYSSSQLAVEVDYFNDQIVTSSRVLELINGLLSTCPSELYLLISLPNVSSVDFSSEDVTPHLHRALDKSSSTIKTSVAIRDVIGTIDPTIISGRLKDRCKANLHEAVLQNNYFSIEHVALPACFYAKLPTLPPNAARASRMSDYDSVIHSLLHILSRNSTFTVLYLTSPPSSQYMYDKFSTIRTLNDYDKDMALVGSPKDMSNMEFSGVNPGNRVNYTQVQRVAEAVAPGIFGRYQFFSSGVFIGVSVLILLLAILSFGLNSILGIEISYQAYSRDTAEILKKIH